MRKFKYLIYLALIISFSFSIHIPALATDIDFAKSLLEKGKIQESISTLLEISKKEPDLAEPKYYLALAHYLKKDYSKTLDYGIQAYCQDHLMVEDIQDFAQAQKFKHEVDIGLIQGIRLAKRARNSFYKILSNDPGNNSAKLGLAYYYIFTPFIISGSNKKALYFADQIAASDKQRAYPVYFQYYRKNSKKQLEIIKQWYSDYPNDWLPVKHLAVQEYDKNKNPIGGYALLSKWFKNNSDSRDKLDYFYQIGRLAALNKQYLEEGEQALHSYLSEKHIENLPKHSAAHWRLAMIYQHQGELEKARIHTTKGLKLAPKDKDLLKLSQQL